MQTISTTNKYLFHTTSELKPEESKMDRQLDVLLQFISKRTDTYLKRLEELVAIPSISEDISHRLDVLKALRWCGIRLKNMGFETCYRKVGDEDIYEGESLPLHPTERVPLPFVLCASLGYDLTKRTLLIYGHVDVKAVAPQDVWATDPFKLTIIEGRMHGRGVADDKGPLLGWINAIEAYMASPISNIQQCNMEVPVNVRFLIEGGEETGSEGLPELLQEMKKDFLKDVDYVAISDSHWLNTNTPCLTYGLRGVVYFYVYVEGSKRDLHSGSHGGVIQEPLIDLQALMSSLVSENGKILVPGIYDCVRRPDKAELERFEQLDFDPVTYINQIQTTALYARDKVEILRRRWLLPSVEFHGIEKSFDKMGAPTLIPKEVMGKFSLRLVPDQNPRFLASRVRCYLKEVHSRRCSGNKLTVKTFSDGRPFLADQSCPNYRAAYEAIKFVWEKEPDLIRDGATISMAAVLEEATNRDVVLIPISENQDFIHNGLEWMTVRNYINGIKVFATYLHKLRCLGLGDPKDESGRQGLRLKWRKSLW
ncbi:unnamed protein product [Hydatigera taeniaeformis]|uniref:M20_dimer domain-containing protein n=1 Tax=Hydatigena taeniaeformis TaxID=6205 RepID=A0A158RDC3_HYDTA|nr:unnamed protein product [Hydatigera taeniaeformis]